jgi:hypothetical protein
MAATYGERLARLGSKLDSVNTRIADLQTQKEDIIGEINNLVSGGGVPAARTIPSKKQEGSLSDAIIPVLKEGTSGWTIAELADRLKTKASRIGLSLHHMNKKGTVYVLDQRYFLNSVTEEV